MEGTHWYQPTTLSNVDYDRVTNNCVNRFRNAMPYYVTYRVESTVGFANQFRSLIGVFLIALVSNRRLRSAFPLLLSPPVDWDDYYNITSSAFTELRYDRNKRMSFTAVITIVKVPTKVYFRFDRNFCNNTRYASFDVEKIFGARHLLFQTLSDLSCLVLPNPAYRSVLKELGFVVDRGDELIRGQIARILLTPNSELTYFIRQNLQAFDTEHVIGIQVRTGGWLASTLENGSFLRRTAVLGIGEKVLKEMERRQWNQTNCKVFLTSDSNIAVRMITGSLQDRASVIVPSGYKAGHSSAYLDGRNHYTHLYRAIMDLVLLSQTSPVFWTYGSSYGLLGVRLSLGEGYDLRNSSVCTHTIQQTRQTTKANYTRVFFPAPCFAFRVLFLALPVPLRRKNRHVPNRPTNRTTHTTIIMTRV